MSAINRHDAQQGSIPLTLIVLIVIGGVVTVLFGVVQSGVRSSARDRDFGQAIHVADAGVQEAYVLLSRALDDDDAWDAILDCPQPPGTEQANTTTEGTCAGVVGTEADFDWTYECVGRQCEVLSVGRYRNSARAVQIEVTDRIEAPSTFDAVEGFGWNGGGSGGSDVPLTIGVGTSVDLPNSESSRCAIRRILYYGPSENFDDVVAATNDPCDDGSELEWEIATMPDVGDPVDPAVCNADNALSPGDAGYPTTEAGLQGGTTYCLRTLETVSVGQGQPNRKLEIVGDGDVIINVLGPETSGTGTPAVDIDQQGTLNADGHPDRLTVNVSSGAVETGAQSEVSMRLFAPSSTCRFQPSNNGYFRGSAFCNSISINGVYEIVDAGDQELIVRPTIGLWTEERVPPGRR